MNGITMVGLGPGDPDLITRRAWAVLNSAAEVWVRLHQHPVLAALPPNVVIHHMENTAPDVSGSAAQERALAQRVLDLGKRTQGVVYAVPGHPLVGADGTCREIARLAQQDGMELQILGGISALDAALAMPGMDAHPCLTICSAADLEGALVPPFPPDHPAIVTDLEMGETAARVRAVLLTAYPADHGVALLQAGGEAFPMPKQLRLADLGATGSAGREACLYVSPLEKGSSLESMQQVVAQLRSPEGCPWDRQQTHASLRRHLLEESYEAMTAMDAGDEESMREEFGDLLLQIILNCQIAAEGGKFTLNDVSKGIYDKIIRRHPHVFGDLHLTAVEGVLANWEKLKEGERHGKGDAVGLLTGVPASMPALSRAQEFQGRAARVGFDWPDIDGVLEKLQEEIKEVETARDPDAVESELGDLLFALVNLARWKGVDAESALRGANNRFSERFAFIEQECRNQRRRLSELSLEEMDGLWRRAKSRE